MVEENIEIYLFQMAKNSLEISQNEVHCSILKL